MVYAADVAIGGAQTFRVVVDTGSTSLGIAGSGCASCGVQPLYAPGTSAVDQKQTATSQFGSGSWSGEIYQDSVAMKPASPVPVKLVSITNQSNFFQQGSTCGNAAYQGLLGMSQPAAAVKGTNGFFDQVVAGGGADIFATELCDDGGTLWLGGYDSAATTGAPQWVPYTSDLASSLYYAVDLETITVGTTAVPFVTGSFKDSVVDTGTSVFLVGQTAYDALSAALSADAGFKQVFGANAADWFKLQQGNPACADLTQTKAQLDAALPPITMTFGASPGITVKALATESYLMPYPGMGWCNAMIPQAQSATGFPLASIMGAPILRSNVTIFDRANKRIGFAPHAACKTSARSTNRASIAPPPGLKRIGPAAR
jgi:hypothetical protein